MVCLIGHIALGFNKLNARIFAETEVRSKLAEVVDAELLRLAGRLPDLDGRARAEIALCGNYDYIIINEEGAVEQTAQRIAEILRAEQCRTPRMQPIIEHFFKSEQGGEKE